MTGQEELNIHWFIALIRRWWRLMLLCTLATALAGFWFASTMKPAYEATATLMVAPVQDSRTDEYSTLVAGERLALTYIEMLEGQSVLKTVASRPGVEASPAQLAEMVEAEPVRGTQLVRLTVKSKDPQEAAGLANTIAETFTEYIQQLQAERYASSLADLQEQIEALTVDIDGTQVQIDSLNAEKIKDEAKLTNLERDLSEQRSDYRQLEGDYKNLLLTISQLTEVVSVVEPARAPNSALDIPNQAAATLLVRRPISAGSIEANDQLIETYSSMILGRPILEAVIARLELAETPESLKPKINANPMKDTQLIRLSVVYNDPAKAALIANTIAEVFIANVKALLENPYTTRLTAMQAQMDDLSVQIEQLQSEIEALTTNKGQIETELVRLGTQLADQRNEQQTLQKDNRELALVAADAAQVVSITEPAQVPEQSSASPGMILIFIAAAAGGALAFGFAFVVEFFNDTIRATEDVNQALGLPLIGTIGRFSKEQTAKSLVVSPELTPDAEMFRVAAANLRFAGLDKPLRTILVTSPNSQDGKSVVAANLAAALALNELCVAVVDADLRRPNLHKIFGLEQGQGLTDALLEKSLDGKLKRVETANVLVLTSGDTPTNPHEIIGSSSLRDLLEELKKLTDMVVIDTPPVLPVADAALLASYVDGVLIVARANHTTKRAALETVDGLRKVGARILGVVLNASPRSQTGYYSYYSKSETEGEGGIRVKDILAPIAGLPYKYSRKK